MHDDRWIRIRSLFREAQELQPEAWSAFLQNACPDDPEMQEEVVRLLRQFDKPDTFLEPPQIPIPKKEAAAPTPETIGPYQIKRVIAQGGMGVVYEAIDTRLEKRVALKTVQASLSQNPGIRRRFEQEAKTLAQLKNPHFVEIYSIQDDGADTYIVMEYVEGITLAEYIQKKGAMPWQQALELGTQLLKALSNAHQKGIIHRDLKPGNIMLTRDADGVPLVKVLDFGISKRISTEATATITQGAIGTLFYMSPEQIRGLSTVDARSDLYALAVTLYETMTGVLPYDISQDQFQIRQQIVEGHIPLIHKQRPDIPIAFSSFFEQALQRDPEKRYPDALSMRDALLTIKEAIKGVQAPPHKVFSAGKAILGIAVILLLTGLLWLMNSTSRTSVQESVATPAVTDEQTDPLPDSFETNEAATLAVSSDIIASDSTPEIVRVPPQSIAPQQPVDTFTVVDSTESIPSDSLEQPLADSSFTSPPAKASLSVLISPVGDLFINDDIVGRQISMEDFQIDAIPQVLRVEQPDFGTWECEVDLTDVSSQTIAVNFLQKIPVTIAANDSETNRPLSGAAIYVDGVLQPDPTPQTIELTPGLRLIRVEIDGYEQVSLFSEEFEACTQPVGGGINFDAAQSSSNMRVVAQMKAN